MKSGKWHTMIFVSFFLLNLINSCAFQKQADGILVKIKKHQDTDAGLVKVQVCTETIIRILATADRSLSYRPSLMTDKIKWDPVPWSVTEDSNGIELSTAKIVVRIQPDDGAVTFLDTNGRVLLQERTPGGKIITPANVMGESTYHIQQYFDSPPGEAFYGLGAHQNAVMNYKGQDVDLWQYNIVDVNPFLVSSRNYGILWDNNSRTKFGDHREYESLAPLKLYGRDGSESGLTAEYFKDRDFHTLFTTRTETGIAHEYTDVNDPYPAGFQQNVQAVRWSGEIACREAGMHKFRLYSSGYCKMWLNGELVVDAWRQNWLPWTYFPTLPMESGKRYQIKIEWIHTGGFIGLKVLPPGTEDFNKTISLYSEVADQIDYYFIAGENLDQVIQGYREITGKTPMMPRWALGLWQCRERYKSQEELLAVVKEFRNRQIPLDNIVQDWFYWKEDQWGSHEFDSTRFPDPDAMIGELHNNLHTRIMISVWPKFYTGTRHFDEFREKGWLYMRNVEQGQKDWVGPGYVSTFYDPYSKEARDLFWEQINTKLFSKGIDAWWLDSTEPDIQSNLSREESLRRQDPTALGSASRYLNTYSLLNARGIYEHQRKTNPEKRVFILTRSAFAGQQRYSAATWSGDIASRWYDLRAQIPAGLNFCLAGIPYWTTDIGGFAVEYRYEHPNEADLEEWRELNTRWFQFGTFCPIFRVHGQFPYREMFNIAPNNHPAYQSMLAYDKLRYRLMPYIYSLAGMVTQQDHTIMRALVMNFGHDPQVFNIADQYMFGPALMINPVTEYKARTRTVYLPAGSGWYDLHSGKYHPGNQTLKADAPYTDIPIFVKAGSILPCGPDIQYTSEKPADPIRLFVYTGADGSFSLYEDEDVNYNYEQGRFSLIPLSYNEKDRILTIGQRQGDFPGMLKTQTFEIVWIGEQKSSGLDFEAEPDALVIYDGSEQILQIK
jgi:alpha-D-xyloside xylohydrolase